MIFWSWEKNDILKIEIQNSDIVQFVIHNDW